MESPGVDLPRRERPLVHMGTHLTAGTCCGLLSPERRRPSARGSLRAEGGQAALQRVSHRGGARKYDTMYHVKLHYDIGDINMSMMYTVDMNRHKV